MVQPVEPNELRGKVCRRMITEIRMILWFDFDEQKWNPEKEWV
jgi:hypothetical protein